jgi:hypothetical protein
MGRGEGEVVVVTGHAGSHVSLTVVRLPAMNTPQLDLWRVLAVSRS